jgi:hypothetical protein
MGTGFPHAGRRVALTVAMGAAAVLLYWSGQGTSLRASGETAPTPLTGLGKLASDDGIALRYAKAYQAGDGDEVIGLTWWMNERLNKTALGAADDRELDTVRDELRSRIQDRPIEGNRIRAEGVEDAYVFAPGATVEFVASDRGRKDLSQPVSERVWLRVTYPTPDSALCDESGKPIRSIIVGVNVSPGGYVVKAGVVGNLDIDRNSISYGWGEVQGG